MTPNKNTPQIRIAIEKIWPSLPDEFHAWQVWSKVKKELPRLDVYPDTIIHAMRKMNQRSDYTMYECLNRTKSLYKKKP